MVEPVKSVLLIDLNGLGRNLAASGGEEMGQRLAARIDDWSGAIESGELIDPAGTRRIINQRRCYVSSASADETRVAFVRAGFEMIECDGPAQVELNLAIDTMDAAAGAEGNLDFILLTAAPNLTRLVQRLHAHGHRVAAYISEATADDYHQAADMVIPAGDFLAFLTESKTPAATSAASSADRDRIEAFAREIHAATNIPMFSPKTFADLFRFLAAEVSQHGYHFNDTAKSVAERLTRAGRTVTPRQVVFVVKGLALKGHVFSTSDSAESLAAVFREQARYLIAGAGITLDGERDALLAAWIAAPTTSPAKPAPTPAATSATMHVAEPVAEPVGDNKPTRKPTAVRKPERPVVAKPATPPRVPERPKSAALPAKVVAPPPPEPAKPAKSTADIRAAIAARIAASAKMKPSARPPLKTESSAPPPPSPSTTAADDAIESSILAAIAEAVDVLVEDGGSEPAGKRSSPERQAPQPPAPRAPASRPPAAMEPEEEGGDIGDEIQRIVATYNRKREDDRRG